MIRALVAARQLKTTWMFPKKWRISWKTLLKWMIWGQKKTILGLTPISINANWWKVVFNWAFIQCCSRVPLFWITPGVLISSHHLSSRRTVRKYSSTNPQILRKIFKHHPGTTVFKKKWKTHTHTHRTRKIIQRTLHSKKSKTFGTETHAVHVSSLRSHQNGASSPSFSPPKISPWKWMESPFATSFSTRVDTLIDHQLPMWLFVMPKIWPQKKKILDLPTGWNGDQFSRVFCFFLGGEVPYFAQQPYQHNSSVSQIQETEEKSRAIHKVMALVFVDNRMRQFDCDTNFVWKTNL